MVQRFVRFFAPVGPVDFCWKLAALVLLSGGLNHLRAVMTDAPGEADPFLNNLLDASFTAVPMCTLALFLIGHLNGLQKKMEALAMHDILTDLPNRRWFMLNTPEVLGPDQAMMIVDIDHFKRINDTYGHDVGDACLQSFATHLRNAAPNDVLPARIGGEEFAALLKFEDVQLLHRVSEDLSSGFDFDTGAGAVVRITASVGVSADTQGQLRGAAMRRADEATYLAKQNGRAGYVILPSLQDQPVRGDPHTFAAQ